MTPVEAKKALAEMASNLRTWEAGLASAKEQLDEASEKVAAAALEQLAVQAIEVAQAFGETVKPDRAKTLIRAAAAGLSPAQLKKIAEAWRVSSKPEGVRLPAGKYENLSRGKGWCRLGSGSNVTWADRHDDGGYLANEAGKWVVGSSDGFNRKDSSTYKVEKVGDFWVASAA